MLTIQLIFKQLLVTLRLPEHHNYQFLIHILFMIEQILAHQRSKSTLSHEKLSYALYGQKYFKDLKHHLETGPTLEHTPNLYNKSRLEVIKDAYRYLPLIYNHNAHKYVQGTDYHHCMTYNFLVNPHQIPGMAHFGMFITYIDLMGTPEHKRLYLDKAISCQIMGCYAQTEVGHGSDIRSLETTATYDQKTQEWIIDSPKTSSAKYWPGQLSFVANYAIVFAQTIVKGKNHGVNSFLVQIKDKEYNWMPGIEGGDVGPKIGFHSKQHGYMYLRHIRVPKGNLFTKYAEITDEGEFRKVGDPRIGYGTMMFIREMISCIGPKTYAQAIIIAARYSFFRKQGLDMNKKEMVVMDYQTQQDKIIPRIAQFYGMNIASNKIRSISQQNSQNVLKEDFSLLQQTHSNLCFSKCLFSELAQDGMEILRRSMGGHGTSYYSGLPQIMNEFSANNTHEGQNTVLYIQTARFVLKNYIGFVTKGKALTDSVKYIAQFQDLAGVEFSGKNLWNIDELRKVLVKTIEYLIQFIGEKMSAKEGGLSEKQIINTKVGIRLQQLAQLHAVHYVVKEFIQVNNEQKDAQIRQILNELCLLFAVSQIQRLSGPIVQVGFIYPQKWSMLNQNKEASLKKIRPHTAILLDSFGIPDKYIRSELISGNPYENFLNRARECEINQNITKSAFEVATIKDVLARKPRL